MDDRDLQIVKTYGKGVGLLKKNEDNQFPKFETYREQIDGKYWFPPTRTPTTRCTSRPVAAHPHGGEISGLQAVRRRDSVTFGDEVPDSEDSSEEVSAARYNRLSMSATKITVNNDGSIRIEGDFEIFDPRAEVRAGRPHCNQSVPLRRNPRTSPFAMAHMPGPAFRIR